MPLTVSDHPRIRRRRTVALVATALTPALLVTVLDHRGVHMARSMLMPGAGLYDEHLWLGVALTGIAVLATVAWMRWGLDWAVALAVVGSVVTSGVVVDPQVHDTATSQPLRSAHEFPLVLIVVGAITWLRAVTRRAPGIATLSRRRAARRRGLDDLARLGPVDRARVAAIAALTADADLVRVTAGWDGSDVDRRCRSIDRWARARWSQRARTRPADHAPIRAARAGLDPQGDSLTDLVAASTRTPWGAPCSEPGWLRPLDAMLAASVMARHARPDPDRTEVTVLVDRWRQTLERDFALRRGHRPAWCWTPLGVAAGSMPPWEHATVAALAHRAGWLDHHRDWEALRRGALGAAARPDRDAHDERLVAAGRWLARLAGDGEAIRILQRAHLRHDPFAVALDRLAASENTAPRPATRPGAVDTPEGHLIR